ncbi:MAG: D-glycero-beta-D-manno-heptose-7-phosphate kinase [candidate division Zixibacteria bacterium]|nr:D-glycero-beta-D-manno-heptose-7-phosphate kinase [candidate division Zixibacteria bacterium]
MEKALTTERIDEIVNGLGRARILILGDIMLDEYLFGMVTRISPEAPVPVVEIASSKHLLGGSANVAANIRTLGGEPILLGTMGEDEASIKLTRLLRDKGITGDAIVNDRSRQTTIKTRIMAHSQQVVRTDREDRHELDHRTERRVLDRFLSWADRIQAVLISDYGKGVITEGLLKKVIDICLEKDIYVAVDPKETHFFNYKRVSLITPNHHEAGFAYGLRIRSDKDLIEVGTGLLQKLEAKSILITRGSDGMSLFQSGSEPTHIPAFARKVFDVTGAGDTVIATFVSAVCAGASLVEAAVVANAAAGITIGEVGTASVNPAELRRELKLNIKNGNLTMAATNN